jgi:hypothetical protein
VPLVLLRGLVLVRLYYLMNRKDDSMIEDKVIMGQEEHVVSEPPVVNHEMTFGAVLSVPEVVEPVKKKK